MHLLSLEFLPQAFFNKIFETKFTLTHKAKNKINAHCKNAL